MCITVNYASLYCGFVCTVNHLIHTGVKNIILCSIVIILITWWVLDMQYKKNYCPHLQNALSSCSRVFQLWSADTPRVWQHWIILNGSVLGVLLVPCLPSLLPTGGLYQLIIPSSLSSLLPCVWWWNSPCDLFSGISALNDSWWVLYFKMMIPVGKFRRKKESE